MRITGGNAKGRTLRFPSGSRERPTSDFLRENLFNLLGFLEDKTFLDLYAGSGSVGMEAASRGAQEIYFVEKNIKLAEIIKINISTCCQDKKFFIINKDAEHAIHNYFKERCEFDIVFADPPYNRCLVEKTLNLLNKYKIIKEEGMIIIQHSIKENIPETVFKKIDLVDKRKYGENSLTFFKWRKNDAG